MTASSVPFVFSPNTLIQSAQVNADFTSVVGSLNNIDAAQITTGVLPVSNGGTGVTTPGAITTSIGAVAKAGDTMTGNLTVPGIIYSGTAGHAISIGWDGNLQFAEDGVYVGATVMRITAGNGLTGGGGPSGGTVTLAMSGSYSGDFTVTGNIWGGAAFTGTYVHSTGSILADGGLTANTVTANGINSNGNLGVGNQTTTGTFYAAGTYGIGNWKLYVTNEIWCNRHIAPAVDGGVFCGIAAFPWAGVEAYAYFTTSDPAVKRDIEPVPDHCLDLVNAIAPKTFKLNLNPSDTIDQRERDKTHWGFLAPDVGAAMAEAGHQFDGVKTEDGRSSLDYNSMISVLWKAVQELTAEVRSLRAAADAAP